jgi:CrcB protein
MNTADIAWVMVGGGLGAIARWLVGLAFGKRYHGSFPLSTFVINISGAFLFGFLSVLFVIDWQDRYGTFLKAAILTGFMGGYTTFSSMQLDSVTLFNRKQYLLSLVYLLVSIGAGLLATIIGGGIARIF